jgi:hypothetical protein
MSDIGHQWTPILHILASQEQTEDFRPGLKVQIKVWDSDRESESARGVGPDELQGASVVQDAFCGHCTYLCKELPVAANNPTTHHAAS